MKNKQLKLCSNALTEEIGLSQFLFHVDRQIVINQKQKKKDFDQKKQAIKEFLLVLFLLSQLLTIRIHEMIVFKFAK